MSNLQSPNHAVDGKPSQLILPDLKAEALFLTEIGCRLLECGVPKNISLLPLTSQLSIAEVRKVVPKGQVFACDLYLTGIEKHRDASGLLQTEGVINIDHHAPLKEMQRFISAGNLAARYVEKFGPAPKESRIVINHTDCDSIVSSLIISGAIPSHPVFERAVIAADHTGESNKIADLLQAIDRKRDVALSVESLGCLLCNKPLPQAAQELLDLRAEERKLLDAQIRRKEYWTNGTLVFIQTTERIDSALLPTYFPESTLVCACKLAPGRTDRWEMRLRLAAGAPEGFSLHDLQLTKNFDPFFGGRWNAGSNRRGNGTPIPPTDYRTLLARCLDNQLSRRIPE